MLVTLGNSLEAILKHVPEREPRSSLHEGWRDSLEEPRLGGRLRAGFHTSLVRGLASRKATAAFDGSFASPAGCWPPSVPPVAFPSFLLR